MGRTSSSPGTIALSVSLYFSIDRTVPRTVYPASAAALATCSPTKPLTPVTRHTPLADAIVLYNWQILYNCQWQSCCTPFYNTACSNPGTPFYKKQHFTISRFHHAPQKVTASSSR
jgi:hypothetical protein